MDSSEIKSFFGFQIILKNFKEVHKSKFTDALTARKWKSRVDYSCLFQSLYSRTIADAVKKGCFRFKTEKVNTTIEFCTFELA